MKIDDYQEKTRRTSPSLGEERLPYLINFSMGLAGEAGEVVDHIKKVAFHGHALNEEEVLNELGDSLYYVARTADALGYKLSHVAEMNNQKLLDRYPNGFSEEASRNRTR